MHTYKKTIHHQTVLNWCVRHSTIICAMSMLIANPALAQENRDAHDGLKPAVVTPDGAWRANQAPLTPCPEELRKIGACLPSVSAGAAVAMEPLYEGYSSEAADVAVVTPDGAWRASQAPLTPCPEDLRKIGACLPSVSAGAAVAMEPLYEEYSSEATDV
jgi:hypothetical protein